MSSTVLTLETHDYEISEVGYTGLAHTHFTHHLAGVAWNLEDNGLFHHEIALLERFSKIELCAKLFSLNRLTLSLSILRTVAHRNQLLLCPLEMPDLHIFILLWSHGIFNC